jgi:hypothetical protein
LGVGFQAAEYLRKDKAFQFIHELDALTLLVNMIDAPNVGVLVDVWDVVAGGGSLESIHKLPAGQIVAVQVAEMPAGVPAAELDDKTRLLPGAENGRIDVTAMLKLLVEVGFDGPVTPRPGRGVFSTRRRDLVVKQAGEAMTRVWQAAGLVSERKFVPTAAAVTADY